jgi:MATE family multidrug resistance protein
MAAWFWRAARFAPYRAQLASRWKHARRMLSLGLPIAGQMLLETGAFVFSALMMGWLGTTALAAHQIAINVASVTYMAASGIGAAATVRVGQFAGAGHHHEVRRAASSALWLAFGFMLLMGLLLILTRHALPYFYVPEPGAAAARALAAELLVIAALFQMSDGVQVAALGVLRGLQDVRVPGLISFIAYWVVALPLGYWLAFPMGYGPSGLWAGLCLGLTLSAVALTWRVRLLSRG